MRAYDFTIDRRYSPIVYVLATGTLHELDLRFSGDQSERAVFSRRTHTFYCSCDKADRGGPAS